MQDWLNSQKSISVTYTNRGEKITRLYSLIHLNVFIDTYIHRKSI